MKKKFIINMIIIVLSLGLIVLGITKGQPGDVLMKAARICLECVGIG